MIHGLITLATCNDLDLQKHALNFAERLLLKGKLDSSYTGIEMLLKLKSMLIDSVEIMRCFDPNQEEIIKRKCILLYCLHLDIVLQAKKQQALGDVNLKIRLEDQTEPIKSFVSSTKTFQSMLFDEAKQFQKDVSSGNVMEETDVYSLVGRKEYKQFYVILQVLKQMFKIQDNGNIDSIVNSFEYLETYLQSKQGLRRRSVSPLCAELILQGILQLLTYISSLLLYQYQY
uniref:Uncharacterized protein n=1 Tax=Biomphalaria glabrata TaxID=6526 RepID=A0A2C9KWI3_BIOGL